MIRTTLFPYCNTGRVHDQSKVHPIIVHRSSIYCLLFVSSIRSTVSYLPDQAHPAHHYVALRTYTLVCEGEVSSPLLLKLHQRSPGFIYREPWAMLASCATKYFVATPSSITFPVYSFAWSLYSSRIDCCFE